MFIVKFAYDRIRTADLLQWKPQPRPMWPDVRIKSSPIFPKVAQKVSTSVLFKNQ